MGPEGILLKPGVAIGLEHGGKSGVGGLLAIEEEKALMNNQRIRGQESSIQLLKGQRGGQVHALCLSEKHNRNYMEKIICICQ